MDDMRMPGRSQGVVSRHTIILKKAKEDDGRRLAADADNAALREKGGGTRAIHPPQRKTYRLPGADAGDATAAAPVPGDNPIPGGASRRVSGKTIAVRRSGATMARQVTVAARPGEKQPSVRVTGGDTIVRYQSGDMVIVRGSRRAELRRQLIWAYALGYLVVFALFVFFLVTGAVQTTPEAYVQRAFAKRRGNSVADLERAAMEAMRGNRTPAEVRLAQSLSFHDENKDAIHINSGDRLTLLTAAKLGKAIIEDLRLPPERRTFAKPFLLYEETYLANMRWPFWLTLYNAIGFFLLVIVFLWNPLREYLGTQGKKTAAALRNSREAQNAAEALRDRYRQLIADVGTKRDAMRDRAEAETKAEHDAAMEAATRRFASVDDVVRTTLAVEEERLFRQLETGTADAACRLARRLLEERLGQREHDIAVDDLIADISALKFA